MKSVIIFVLLLANCLARVLPPYSSDLIVNQNDQFIFAKPSGTEDDPNQDNVKLSPHASQSVATQTAQRTNLDLQDSDENKNSIELGETQENRSKEDGDENIQGQIDNSIEKLKESQHKSSNEGSQERGDVHESYNDSETVDNEDKNKSKETQADTSKEDDHVNIYDQKFSSFKKLKESKQENSEEGTQERTDVNESSNESQNGENQEGKSREATSVEHQEVEEGDKIQNSNDSQEDSQGENLSPSDKTEEQEESRENSNNEEVNKSQEASGEKISKETNSSNSRRNSHKNNELLNVGGIKNQESDESGQNYSLKWKKNKIDRLRELGSKFNQYDDNRNGNEYDEKQKKLVKVMNFGSHYFWR